jgi:hypothetical protein
MWGGASTRASCSVLLEAGNRLRSSVLRILYKRKKYIFRTYIRTLWPEIYIPDIHQDVVTRNIYSGHTSGRYGQKYIFRTYIRTLWSEIYIPDINQDVVTRNIYSRHTSGRCDQKYIFQTYIRTLWPEIYIPDIHQDVVTTTAVSWNRANFCWNEIISTAVHKFSKNPGATSKF